MTFDNCFFPNPSVFYSAEILRYARKHPAGSATREHLLTGLQMIGEILCVNVGLPAQEWKELQSWCEAIPRSVATGLKFSITANLVHADRPAVARDCAAVLTALSIYCGVH